VNIPEQSMSVQTQVAAHLQPLTTIEDVFIAPIKAFADERGAFMETFRKEWFPAVNWDRIQSNCSVSKAGVLRGLHYHHHQIDYWYVTRGTVRVGMVDLRPSSPTYMATHVLELGEVNNAGLFIPVGVAHGFYTLTDATLTYLVNNYYDGGKDENGVAWNDPDIGMGWGVNDPLISPRDAGNPFLRDIPRDKLPH
jgi:dTDP-4-dehydrorhamnose 3,5-epimerase